MYFLNDLRHYYYLKISNSCINWDLFNKISYYRKGSYDFYFKKNQRELRNGFLFKFPFKWL